MRRPPAHLAVALVAVLASGTLLKLTGCSRAAPKPASAQANTIELVFTYGSEKQKWLTEVTDAYNKANHAIQAATGQQTVQVRLVAMGSGECIDALLGKYTPDADNKKAGPKGELGADKAHLTSPASKAYVQLGNAEWAAAGNAKPLVSLDESKDLVTSPIVVAMWKSRAEALGWPQTPIGWADITKLAQNPKGWDGVGQPLWGRFKLAHTHPEYSNSGLMSVLALAYAGANKTEKLELADVKAAGTRDFLAKIESAVEFYGQSTGFLKDTLIARGVNGVHAGVVYESSVFEANDPAAKVKPEEPLVAIYPREGTFISQHPVGIVEKDYVTADHRAAAKDYIKFLLEPDQQKKAALTGFRPGVEGVEWDKTSFTAERGVDLLQPKAELELPSAEVMKEVKKTWVEVKKPIRAVLAIDVSGSMQKDGKLQNAKAAAKEFVDLLGDKDELALLAFSTNPAWPSRKFIPMNAEGKAQIKAILSNMIALDDTALYDAVAESVTELRTTLADRPRDRVPVVVVLSDGEDTSSKNFKSATDPATKKAKASPELLKAIAWGGEKVAVRVFTVSYGKDATPEVLKEISDAASGKKFDGKPEDIRKVLRGIVLEF